MLPNDVPAGVSVISAPWWFVMTGMPDVCLIDTTVGTASSSGDCIDRVCRTVVPCLTSLIVLSTTWGDGAFRTPITTGCFFTSGMPCTPTSSCPD